MAIEAPTLPASPERPAPGPELVADFLREVRHEVEAGADPLLAAQRAAAGLPTRIRTALEAIVRRLRGEHHEDEFGFDEQLAEAMFGLIELGYDLWWRGDVAGVRNVPAHGGALLVVNRPLLPAPIAAPLITTAIMKGHPLPRWPRFMTPPAALAPPIVSTVVRRCGGVPADARTAVALLGRGELVCCFDEREFAAIALRARAPIVPVAILGSPARRIEFRAPIRRSERDSGYDRLDDRQRNAG
jgi:hypothetical protein